MKLDVSKIKELILNESISAYSIQAETGITRSTLSNYRNGKADIENMSLANAIKVQNYINNKEKKEMTTTYEIYSMTNDNEYHEATITGLKEALEKAEEIYDQLSDHDKVDNVIEVRFDITDMVYDTALVLDHSLYNARKDKVAMEDRLYDIESMKDDYEYEDEYLEELYQAHEACKKFNEIVNKLERR